MPMTNLNQKSNPSSTFIPTHRTPRLFFVRHAQRVDRYVKDMYPKVKNWPERAFGPKQSAYGQFNIEMPPYLPKRNVDCYADDTPITTMGEMCARILGNRIAEMGFRIDYAYTSPSQRCVLTCHHIVQGYNDFAGSYDTKIRMDGGLYEWGSLSTGPVNFESPKFYKDRGVPCDTHYKNTIEQEELRHQTWESYAEFCQRANLWINDVIRKADKTTDTMLLVTHAPTLITFVRELFHLTTDEDSLEMLANKPSYLACVLLEFDKKTEKWFLPHPQPTPSFEIRVKTTFRQQWFDRLNYM